MPKPYESLTAEVIISFIVFSSLMWTGIFMVISHVDAVGLQQQPCRHPCRNSSVNFLGNPKGGICEEPVIHFTKSVKVTPSIPVKKMEALILQGK